MSSLGPAQLAALQVYRDRVTGFGRLQTTPLGALIEANKVKTAPDDLDYQAEYRKRNRERIRQRDRERYYREKRKRGAA